MAYAAIRSKLVLLKPQWVFSCAHSYVQGSFCHQGVYGSLGNDTTLCPVTPEHFCSTLIGQALDDCVFDFFFFFFTGSLLELRASDHCFADVGPTVSDKFHTSSSPAFLQPTHFSRGWRQESEWMSGLLPFVSLNITQSEPYQHVRFCTETDFYSWKVKAFKWLGKPDIEKYSVTTYLN